MASCKVEELSRDSKHLASASDEVTICDHDDAAAEQQSDTSNTTHKNQTPGKFRRTAFRIFGVRKNICILPSLFGGRSKNQNKWSSKKGIGKSKTHDGLSKAMYDNSLGVGYTSSGNLEYLSQKASTEKLDSSLHGKIVHPVADQKSLSLPRQRKGLRSLFQSIRYHRNHRNVELEKNPICSNEMVAVKDNVNKNIMQCQLSELDVPGLKIVACDSTFVKECNDSVSLEASVLKQESPKSSIDNQMTGDQMGETNVMSVIAIEYAVSSRAHSESCPQLHMSPEPKMKTQVPTGSSDQLNLIFEDVESLKSFDSLTGCGDIIADQDDDSIAESTVSGERSRNAGKRNSCYLTYQGGGEEMASPENLEGDSLHDLWGNKDQEEVCCTCNKDHNLPSPHQLDFVTSNCAQAAGNVDTSPGDVLTPQSDHQESVPNSDEGYYDSTTPGPDECQEKAEVEGTRVDRLPRDSYSGDALYELFAPDDSLISPLFENHSTLPDSESFQCLANTGDIGDSAFSPEINILQDAELYKKDLDNVLETELPNMSSMSKELAQFTIGACDKSSENINSSPPASFTKNIKIDASDQVKGNMLSLKDINKSSNSEFDKRQGQLPFLSKSHPDFDCFSLAKFSDIKEHLEEKNHVNSPYRAASTCSAISNDADYGQTVCFSQALVDYTKHSKLLSNSHDNDDLENNSSFTQNMQALPTIVTFDVVDMHNEGEYDEQIHMEMEDDITSPYQQFEESYLQKDAFAECDHQLLDIYEQNIYNNTWAIASLPRNLGLTKTYQLLPNSLSLDRRSRSLDTESLELNMAAISRENMAGGDSGFQTERNTKREPSVLEQNNVHISTTEVMDTRGFMFQPLQTKAERSLSPPLTDGKSERVNSVSQTQGINARPSGSSTSDCYNGKSQQFTSSGLDRAPCEFRSQSTELYNQQCHLPSDRCITKNAFVCSGITKKDLRTVSTSDEVVFHSSAISSQSSKNKLGANAQEMHLTGNPLNPSATKEDNIGHSRPMDLLHSMACLSEASLN